MEKKFNVTNIDIKDLLLDHENPRIPEDKKGLSQEKLLVYVANNYNAIAIARSIAQHTYFPSEPLIVLKENKRFIVVEGNRRLAALKLLLNRALMAKLEDPAEWELIQTTEKIPTKVPVVIVTNRKQVAPIIGYRHIAGIQQWDPYAKARYIASQKDSGMTFDEVARGVGEKEIEIKSSYRNYRIAKQIKDLGIDTSHLVAQFGVFTRAMQSSDIRAYIGAPAPRDVTEKNPLPKGNENTLKELVDLIFGPNSVINDSRDITTLGKVLSSESGLTVLRETRDLEEANIARGGPLEKLKNNLTMALNNLRAARPTIENHREEQIIQKLLDDCASALKDLRE